jgi:hypothetical protein
MSWNLNLLAPLQDPGEPYVSVVLSSAVGQEGTLVLYREGTRLGGVLDEAIVTGTQGEDESFILLDARTQTTLLRGRRLAGGEVRGTIYADGEAREVHGAGESGATAPILGDSYVLQRGDRHTGSYFRVSATPTSLTLQPFHYVKGKEHLEGTSWTGTLGSGGRVDIVTTANAKEKRASERWVLHRFGSVWLGRVEGKGAPLMLIPFKLEQRNFPSINEPPTKLQARGGLSISPRVIRRRSGTCRVFVATPIFAGVPNADKLTSRFGDIMAEHAIGLSPASEHGLTLSTIGCEGPDEESHAASYNVRELDSEHYGFRVTGYSTSGDMAGFVRESCWTLDTTRGDLVPSSASLTAAQKQTLMAKARAAWKRSHRYAGPENVPPTPDDEEFLNFEACPEKGGVWLVYAVGQLELPVRGSPGPSFWIPNATPEPSR